MKRYIFLVLVTIFFFCFSSSLVTAQGSDTTEFPGGFVLYHYQDEYLDFSFIYPEEWINQSCREKGIIIYLPEFKGTLTFRPMPLFGEENNLSEIAAKNMENLKEAGAVFLESVPDKLSGHSAQRTLYTMKFGNKILKYIRYEYIINDLYYTFSFNTIESDFEKYLNDILKIVRSIKINK